VIISDSQTSQRILDPHGTRWRTTRAHARCFNLTLTRECSPLLVTFPPDTLQPGDVRVTNESWLCAGHLFDARAGGHPVFGNGRLSR